MRTHSIMSSQQLEPRPEGAHGMATTMPPADLADLNDPDAFVDGIPHETFAYWRAHDPVHWTEHPTDGPVLVGHDLRRGRRREPRRRDLLEPARRRVHDGPRRGDARAARPPHAHDGPAPPHPLPAAREPGVHAEAHPRPRRVHPAQHAPRSSTRSSSAAKPTSSSTSRPSCRSR